MIPYGPKAASPEYQKLRAELLEAEISLRDQRERVAALRRQLPQDFVLENDYVLQEGPADLAAGDEPIRDVPLSALLPEADRPLVLVHFMFGGTQTAFCPMCTLWADGYDGIVPHLRQRADLGVLVAGDPKAFRAHARSRRWRNLRLLSAGSSSIKRDLGFEHADGRQDPGVSVFTRDAQGRTLHVYSGGAFLGNGQFRGMDLLSPLWHFLDLTPAGRGDWVPRLAYTDP
jgi:predicted dithiol-disulfide oxidoreductase (DUF899 family)